MQWVGFASRAFQTALSNAGGRKCRRGGRECNRDTRLNDKFEIPHKQPVTFVWERDKYIIR